jgi:hypothetical protein
MTDVSLERRAAVRAANFEIVAKARKMGFRERLPILCECGDAKCLGLARLQVDGFDVIASRPSWFVTGDGHGSRFAVTDAADGDLVLRRPEDDE